MTSDHEAYHLDLLSQRQLALLQGSPRGLWRLWCFSLTLFVTFLLAGCDTLQGPATSPDQMLQDPRVQLATGCQGYVSGLSVATAAAKAGRLSSGSVARIQAVRSNIGPVCENQATQNATTALLAVNAAIIELTAAAGSN